jgi:hypothetical protein
MIANHPELEIANRSFIAMRVLPECHQSDIILMVRQGTIGRPDQVGSPAT